MVLGGQKINKVVTGSVQLQYNRNPNSLFHFMYGDIREDFSVLSLLGGGGDSGVKEKGSNQKTSITEHKKSVALQTWNVLHNY